MRERPRVEEGGQDFLIKDKKGLRGEVGVAIILWMFQTE